MVYGGANIQQTNIPLPHHLQQAANSENIINLSTYHRDPIIPHNLPQNIPQSLGLYPTISTEQMQTQQLQAQQSLLSNHHQAIVQQQQQQQQLPEQQQMYAENRYVAAEPAPPPISVPVVVQKEPEYNEEPPQSQKEPMTSQEEQPIPMEQDIQEQSETPSQQQEQMEQGEQAPEQELEEKTEEEPSEDMKKEEGEEEGVETEQAATAEESEEVKEEEDSEAVKPEPKQEEPDVDPNQCRVCTNTEDLLDIFTVEYDMRISDLIMKICTNIRIHERDYLPHMICTGCVSKLKTAFDFKNTCETTDKELRQKLKRSRNKVRKPSDFVLIDCNVFDEDSDDNDEENDDDFKVSDGAEEIDSDESFETRSRKRQPPKKRPIKKAKSKGKSKSRSAPARGASTPAPANKTPARSSRSTTKTTSATTNKKKPEPSKPDIITSTSKRLKRDIVYIEANYESSDDEVISAKKKRTSSAKAQESPVKGGVNITSSDDKAKHICKECNIECSSKKALSKHRAASHFQPGEDAPFRCLICNRGFKYNINLTSHMQIHKDNYTCDCGKTFSNKGDLKKHTNSEHKNDNSITYECSKCKRFFSSLTRYEKHRESCTSVPASQKTIKISAPSAVKKQIAEKRVREEAAAAAAPSSGKDLFKTVAPLTTTYWSDSFSD